MTGIVPDHVIAVRVDGSDAVMGANAFIAHFDEDHVVERVTLTTSEREYEIRFESLPDL